MVKEMNLFEAMQYAKNNKCVVRPAGWVYGIKYKENYKNGSYVYGNNFEDLYDRGELKVVNLCDKVIDIYCWEIDEDLSQSDIITRLRKENVELREELEIAEDMVAEDKTELAPCPFCGHKAKLESRYIHGSPNTKAYWVRCIFCQARQQERNRARKAIFQWNDRIKM
jgi:hypothetical protein